MYTQNNFVYMPGVVKTLMEELGEDGRFKWWTARTIANRLLIYSPQQVGPVLRRMYADGKVERFTNRGGILKYRLKT